MKKKEKFEVPEHLLESEEWAKRKIYENSTKEQVRERINFFWRKHIRYSSLLFILLILIFGMVCLLIMIEQSKEIDRLSTISTRVSQHLCEQNNEVFWNIQSKDKGNLVMVRCENTNILIDWGYER